MDLPLKHPLTIGKLTISKLTFRDHTTGADYLSFDLKGGVAQRQALVASMTGTDVSLIQQLHGVDYLAAAAKADALIEADEQAVFKGEADPEKKLSSS